MNQAALGHQAYVICPMVEDNEISESENVTDYTVELRKNLPGLTVEGLHGQMAADTKMILWENSLRAKYRCWFPQL